MEVYQLEVTSTADYLATMVMIYANLDSSATDTVIYGASILVSMYVLIIFEVMFKLPV